jgi:exopolysaccharide biosynthesis protein
LVLGGGTAAASPIVHRTLSIGGKSFHAVIADVRSGHVVTEAVYCANAKRQIATRPPLAAITGTFYAPASRQPVGDVVVDGRLVARGARGSAIGVDWYGNVKVFDTGFQARQDWYEYRHALRGAVRLVRDGRRAADPRAQRFRDPRIWGRAARTAAGVTFEGKLVLLATRQSVTLSELAAAAIRLGVRDGVSLDGGGSTFLAYRGRTLIGTRRPLNNLLVVRQAP